MLTKKKNILLLHFFTEHKITTKTTKDFKPPHIKILCNP